MLRQVPRAVNRHGDPSNITRGKDGDFYIAEQEDDGKPAHDCVRDANGMVLARVESRHVHRVGVDSRSNICTGLTHDRSVDKFVAGRRTDSRPAVAARMEGGKAQRLPPNRCRPGGGLRFAHPPYGATTALRR